MQTVFFRSSYAFDHVQRALDILRKMHFGLVRLSVKASDEAFIIVITFEQRGSLPAGVFIDRLTQLDGVVIQQGPVLAGTESRTYPQMPHPAAACH